ncbi:MAG: MmgE/PrpD family protein [Hyphomicrobiaceae bacterium]|nr:MmgE/PrpD family protein [Hyphomicrobiaceae bacterium]
MTAKSELMSRIGAFIADINRRPLDATVSRYTRRAIIDWFSCELPGIREAPATLLMETLADELDVGPCSLPGTGRRALPRAAALITGTASHIVEFDDIFRDGTYHPGCPVVAAVLAAAEARGKGGAAILKGVAAGYEVSTRISAAIQPAHARHWHTTGTVGCFGAAAGVAALIGLDATKAMHAVSTVGTFTASLQQAFMSESMSKPMHAGRAAEAGLLAAFAAEKGVTGAFDILEGPSGFGAATADGGRWHGAMDDLGQSWNIMRMTVKNHGCCGHSFPAIDGALALQAEHGLTPADIKAIRIGGYEPTVKLCGSVVEPRSSFEGKFSVRYCVAHALVYGSVRLDAYDGDHLANPDVLRIARATDVAVDAEAAAAFPKRRSALVTIETMDGRRLERRQLTRKGDPDAPLSDEEVSAKFLELAAPVIGEAEAARLLERLWSLDGEAMPLAA